MLASNVASSTTPLLGLQHIIVAIADKLALKPSLSNGTWNPGTLVADVVAAPEGKPGNVVAMTLLAARVDGNSCQNQQKYLANLSDLTGKEFLGSNFCQLCHIIV
jgi:hypothetical protein